MAVFIHLYCLCLAQTLGTQICLMEVFIQKEIKVKLNIDRAAKVLCCTFSVEQYTGYRVMKSNCNINF